MYFLTDLIIFDFQRNEMMQKTKINVETNFFFIIHPMSDLLPDHGLHSFINFYLLHQTYFRLFGFAFRNFDFLSFTHFFYLSTLLKERNFLFKRIEVDSGTCLRKSTCLYVEYDV